MSQKDTSKSSTVPGAASLHVLPPLPYAENAFDPVITAKTMSFHYGKDGHMVLRWVGSALHEAAGGFRCVRGFRDMKHLASALSRSVKLDSPVQLKVA